MPTPIDELFYTLELKRQNFDRALADVQSELKRLGVSSGVAADRLERLEAQTATSATVEKDFGEKVLSVTKKVAEAIAVHEAWALSKGHLIKATQSLASSSASLGAAIGSLTAKVSAAEAAATGLARGGLALLRGGLAGLAALIGVKLVFGFGKFLDQLGAAGAAIAVTKQGFDNLANSIGETGDVLLARLRRATLGTVDDFHLLQSGSFALQTEIAATGEQMAEMARLATILSLAAGTDAAEGFKTLTAGIARHSVILLKQLGIVVEADEAYRKYAARLHTTVDALSDHQRAQAFTNEVMAVARRNVQRLSIDTDNLAVANAQAAAASANLRLAFAREVAESEQLIRFKRELLGLTTELKTQTQELAPAVGAVTDAFFGWLRAELAAQRTRISLLGRLLPPRFDEEFTKALTTASDRLDGELGRPLEDTIRQNIREGWDEFAERVRKAREELENLPPITMPELPPIFGGDDVAFRDWSERVRRVQAAQLAGDVFPPGLAPEIENLDAELVDLSETFQGSSEAAQHLYEVITQPWGDFLRDMASAFEDDLVPGARAMAEEVTISQEEIESLARVLIDSRKPALAYADTLKDMGIEGANANAVLNEVGQLLRESGNNAKSAELELHRFLARLSLIERSVDGVLQLAEAFGVVDDKLEAVVRSLKDVAAGSATLVQSLKSKNAEGIIAGATQLLGGLAGLAAGLFKENPQDVARRKIIEENTKALEELRRNIHELAGKFDITGSDFSRAVQAFQGLDFSLGFNSVTLFHDLGELRRRLNELGLSFADLEDVAAEFGIQLRDETGKLIPAALRDLQAALEDSASFFLGFPDTLTGVAREAELTARIYDLDDPALQLAARLAGLVDASDEFTAWLDRMAAQGRDATEALGEWQAGLLAMLNTFGSDILKIPALRQLYGLDLTTAEGRVQADALIRELFRQFQAGTLDYAMLGFAAPQEFLDFLAAIEELLDEIEANTAEGAAGATQGVHFSTRVTEAQGDAMLARLDTGLFFDRRRNELLEGILAALGGSITPLAAPAAAAVTNNNLDIVFENGSIVLTVGAGATPAMAREAADVFVESVDRRLGERVLAQLRLRGRA